jgi:outer membrane protein assembly factor BamB
MYRDNEAPQPVVVAAVGGSVFGLSRATGDQVWEQELDAMDVRIALHRDRVVAVGNEVLLVIDQASGRRLERVALPFGHAGPTTIVCDGDHIFVGRGGELVALDFDGAILWKQPFSGMGTGSVAIGAGNRVQQAR